MTLKTSDGDEVTKEVRIAAMGRTSDSLIWKPKTIGDFTLTLDVPKHADETLADNNKLTAPIAIREEKLRVLVVESFPRWEYRYLRNALSRDPGVELSCLLFHPGLSKVGGGNKDYIKQFPGGPRRAVASTTWCSSATSGSTTASSRPSNAGCSRAWSSIRPAGWCSCRAGKAGSSRCSTRSWPISIPVVLDDVAAGRLGLAHALPVRADRARPPQPAHQAGRHAGRQHRRLGRPARLPVVRRRSLRAKAGSEVLCVHKDAVERVRPPAAAGHADLRRRQGAVHGDRRRLAVAKGVEDKYHYRFWGQVVRWMAYQRNMAKGETMRLYYSPDQPQVRQTLALNANVMERSGEPLAEGDVVGPDRRPLGQGRDGAVHLDRRRVGRVHRPLHARRSRASTR